MKPEIQIVADTEALYRAGAAEFVRQAGVGVGVKGLFTVALSGGSTPKGLYGLLATDPALRAHVHRIEGEHPDARQAAEDYEQTLRAFFHSSEGLLPRFDLVFLGLGPEGHTASLFPGTKGLHEEKRLVVSNWVGKFYTERITMTAPVLNNAACVIFLVSGGDKALPLKAVLEGPYEPEQLPAQLIRPKHGRLLWLIDEVAARLLQGDRR